MLAPCAHESLPAGCPPGRPDRHRFHAAVADPFRARNTLPSRFPIAFFSLLALPVARHSPELALNPPSRIAAPPPYPEFSSFLTSLDRRVLLLERTLTR